MLTGGPRYGSRFDGSLWPGRSATTRPRQGACHVREPVRTFGSRRSVRFRTLSFRSPWRAERPAPEMSDFPNWRAEHLSDFQNWRAERPAPSSSTSASLAPHDRLPSPASVPSVPTAPQHSPSPTHSHAAPRSPRRQRQALPHTLGGCSEAYAGVSSQLSRRSARSPDWDGAHVGASCSRPD
jgi:hypothetical protein